MTEQAFSIKNQEDFEFYLEEMFDVEKHLTIDDLFEIVEEIHEKKGYLPLVFNLKWVGDFIKKVTDDTVPSRDLFADEQTYQLCYSQTYQEIAEKVFGYINRTH